MQRDIRKWLMKPHDNGNGIANKAEHLPSKNVEKGFAPHEADASSNVYGGHESSARRKTSKYFKSEKQLPNFETASTAQKTETLNAFERALTSTSQEQIETFDDSNMVLPSKDATSDIKSNKRLKSNTGKRISLKSNSEDLVGNVGVDKDASDMKTSKRLKSSTGNGISLKRNDEDLDWTSEVKDSDTAVKPAGGRGHGRRGQVTASEGGVRGGSRGFANFGERKDPPHKGEKDIPEGAPDCLSGLTFVISGTLDSLEREEAEDLIKRHGGRVTGSVSKKTSYLLCDEDIEGRKSTKAKELGIPFLTEDALLEMIHSSATVTPKERELKESAQNHEAVKTKNVQKAVKKRVLTDKPEVNLADSTSPLWAEKYRPTVPNDIIANLSLINELHNWLKNWDDHFLYAKTKGNAKKQSDPNAKKAALLSGGPGIGKTTAAKLVCQMLGFQPIEVNASDSRGKADANVYKGIGGSNANSIKELVSNKALSIGNKRPKHPKSVLIMDEVDGMSAGDRGGIADLIASIKISRIPIICICNDRYSQKLKSLLNYCTLLNFRKPTKQQMAKRLMHIASMEGIQIDQIAVEELAERANGDMRMAVNQLQYMSLSSSIIKYDDVKRRSFTTTKDEDISPFTAVDKLFGFNGGKLSMDDRVDFSMSDPDLVPLIIQENYINYRPGSIGKDDNGLQRMKLISRAADSIASGDVVNVQIRRYRQWQLSQSGAFASCIIPAALLHGHRETFEPKERNFNRFSSWLGRNSTATKNLRLLDDLHLHLLASRVHISVRSTLRLDYFTLLLKGLVHPLHVLPKDEAIKEVVEFMNTYSITQEDTNTIIELSKFQGHTNPLDGVPSTTKSALTRAYKDATKSRMVKASDLVALPGVKRASKRRVTLPVDPDLDTIAEEEEEESVQNEDRSDSEPLDNGTNDGQKLQSKFRSLNSNGVKVELDLESAENTKAKRSSNSRKHGTPTEKPSAGRGRGSTEKTSTKRKR